MATSNLTAMTISDGVIVSSIKEQMFLNTINQLCVPNISIISDIKCTGNIHFGKIKICRNDNGETMKVYYDDKLIFDEKEYLEQNNQFIKIIKETNV